LYQIKYLPWFKKPGWSYILWRHKSKSWMPCFSYPVLLATLGEGLNDGSSTTIIRMYTDFWFFLNFTDFRFYWYQKISIEHVTTMQPSNDDLTATKGQLTIVGGSLCFIMRNPVLWFWMCVVLGCFVNFPIMIHYCDSWCLINKCLACKLVWLHETN